MKINIPALKNILKDLKIKGAKVVNISSTDGAAIASVHFMNKNSLNGVYLERDISINCNEDFNISISIKMLKVVIKSHVACDLHYLNFAVVNNMVCFITKNSSYNIPIIDKDSRHSVNAIYPHVKPVIINRDICLNELSTAALTSALKRVAPSSSVDINRKYLNGVFFKFKKGSLEMVATNGRTLAFETINQKVMCYDDFSFLLPNNVVKPLIKAISKNEYFYISKHEGFVKLEGVGFRFVISVPRISYPDYHDVLDDTGKAPIAKIDSMAIFSVMKNINKFPSKTNFKVVLLSFGTKGVAIDYNIKFVNIVSHYATDGYEMLKSAPFAIGVDSSLLGLFCSSPSGVISLSHDGENSPILIQNSEFPNFKFLLSPAGV